MKDSYINPDFAKVSEALKCPKCLLAYYNSNALKNHLMVCTVSSPIEPYPADTPLPKKDEVGFGVCIGVYDFRRDSP